MNGEGSQSDRDKPVEIDDNVIRLTDWLGPREELVPFGPAAASEQARPAGRDTTGAVPAADDFWSESSAAVQDAVMASSADARHAGAGKGRAPRSRASAAAVWGRRRASLRAPAIGRTDQGELARELPGLGLVATLITAVVAVAIVASGVASQGRSRPAHLGGQGAIEQADLATHRWAVANASRSLGRRAAARLPSHPRTLRPSGTRRTSGHTVRHRAAAPVSSAEPVGYTTPAATPESTATTQTPAVPRPTQTATSSTPTATSQAGSGSGSASQPVLGANGSLAPGSSPDG